MTNDQTKKKERAIEVLRKLPIGLMDLSCEQKSDLTEALNIALAALRGPTREQVEKARGEWISDLTGQKVDAEINEDGLLDDNDGVHCSVCGGWLTASDEYYCAARFCPHCGSPMTDKAVDIVMRRLEVLYGEP